MLMTEVLSSSMSEDINNNEKTENQQELNPTVKDDWMVGI